MVSRLVAWITFIEGTNNLVDDRTYMYDTLSPSFWLSLGGARGGEKPPLTESVLCEPHMLLHDL